MPLITIPVKYYTYDFYQKKFSSVLIDREYFVEEEWKELYFRDKPSGYTISNLGHVRKPDGSESPLYYDKDGYTRFSLYIPKHHPVYKNSKRIAYPYKTHRAVAELFLVNPDPSEYNLVMHCNDIHDCNVYLNLMWGNAQMNMDDKHFSDRHRYLRGSDKSESIFSEYDVRKICECLYVKNIKKIPAIIKENGYENRDSVFLKSYKNLIHNVKSKHCWLHVISEYTEI